MNIAKRVITVAAFASVSALAQAEVAPVSSPVPDSTQAQPVAETPEVAAPEIVPADSAVVDSTAQNAEPEMIEENREAVAEAVADSTAPVADSTVAAVVDSMVAPVADSVKTEEVVAVAAPDTAKPQVDSIAPVDTLPLVAAVDTPAVKVDTVPAAKANEPVASPLDNILHGNSYNPVANEAAAATVGGEMSIPHKMFNRRFAYFEPVEQEGVVSFGQNMTYFFAFTVTLTFARTPLAATT